MSVNQISKNDFYSAKKYKIHILDELKGISEHKDRCFKGFL